MPRQPPEWALESANLAHPDPAVWLIEIRSPEHGPLTLPNGTQGILRLTPNREPLSWGTSDVGAPLTWDPYPISFQKIDVSEDGSIPAIELVAANTVTSEDASFINPALGSLLLQTNDMLSDHRVLLHLVQWKGVLEPIHLSTITGTVVDSGLTWEAVSLTLSNFNLTNFTIPQRIVGPSCWKIYKSAECGFVGDPGDVELGLCTYTESACEARGDHEAANGLEVLHPLLFGGFSAAARGPIRVGL